MSRRSLPWLVLAGVLVAALSLRSPIIAITPVLPDIIGDLGINAASAGLLTTAPIIMFAVITPAAALLIRRAGPELALLLTLSGVLIGICVRALPGYGAMLTGMFIIGAAIAIGNIVIPVIIRRDVPTEYTAVATALYTATLNVGSLITAIGTAPLAELTGWSTALLMWGILTVAGIALWLVHIVRSRTWKSADRTSGEAAPVRRDSLFIADTITGPLPVVVDSRVRAIISRPIVWLLMLSFGTQSAAYYAVSTWLPTLLRDTTGADASTAGAVASTFQGVAIAGALLAPLLIRYLGATASVLTLGVCWTVMVFGLWFAPEFALIWAGFGAIAQSSGYVIIFTALVRVSRSDAETATMSAIVQGGGYVLSAVGAPLMGAVYESSGGWAVPLAGLFVVVAVYTAAMLLSMRVMAAQRGGKAL